MERCKGKSNNNISIVGLVETKIKQSKEVSFFKKLPASWQHCTSYNKKGLGRILVCWDTLQWQAELSYNSQQMSEHDK